MNLDDYLHNFKVLLYDINSIKPISNAELTHNLGLKCPSRSGYITYNIIKKDNPNYRNIHNLNIVAQYNPKNEDVTFDNRESKYNNFIQNAKECKYNIIQELYKCISQQTNQKIRQCEFKTKFPILKTELNHNDDLVYNFLQLMVNANMLKTYTENRGRYYELGDMCEYIEPIIINTRKYPSKGEAAVAQYLEERNIQFTAQKKYPNCRHKQLLSFDFCLKLNNTEILIEYNGRQHYEPVKIFGGDDKFADQTIRDSIKKEFASANGIPLITIHHSIISKNNIATYLDEELKDYL
jgi:hypothetical protein